MQIYKKIYLLYNLDSPLSVAKLFLVSDCPSLAFLFSFNSSVLPLQERPSCQRNQQRSLYTSRCCWSRSWKRLWKMPPMQRCVISQVRQTLLLLLRLIVAAAVVGLHSFIHHRLGFPLRGKQHIEIDWIHLENLKKLILTKQKHVEFRVNITGELCVFSV